MKKSYSKSLISEYSDEKLMDTLKRRKYFVKSEIDKVVKEAIERGLYKDEKNAEVKHSSNEIQEQLNPKKTSNFIKNKKDFKKRIWILFVIGFIVGVVTSEAFYIMKINTDLLFSFYLFYFGLLIFCSIRYNNLIANIISWFASIQILIILIIIVGYASGFIN